MRAFTSNSFTGNAFTGNCLRRQCLDRQYTRTGDGHEFLFFLMLLHISSLDYLHSAMPSQACLRRHIARAPSLWRDVGAGVAIAQGGRGVALPRWVRRWRWLVLGGGAAGAGGGGQPGIRRCLRRHLRRRWRRGLLLRHRRQRWRLLLRHPGRRCLRSHQRRRLRLRRLRHHKRRWSLACRIPVAVLAHPLLLVPDATAQGL